MARIKGLKLRKKGKKRNKSSAKKQLKKMNKIWKSEITNASTSDSVPTPPSSISEPVEDSSSASPTDDTTSGAPKEAVNNPDAIPGFIFLCSKKTKPRCFLYQVFGMPMSEKSQLEKIKPGTKLFLFDFGMRLLHGIYEAVSEGQERIEPAAFDGKFLAQVKFKIVKECLPIPERFFKDAILENYHATGRIRLDLTEEQVNKLVPLFRPLSSSSSDYVDLPFPNAAPAQSSRPMRRENPHNMNWRRLNSQRRVGPQPTHRPVQIPQRQQPRASAYVNHVNPSFQHHRTPATPIGLFNAHSQGLQSSRGHTMFVQEPYPRYISEQEWLQVRHTMGLGNEYHPFSLTREPLRPGHSPHPQEIDAWYHHQSSFLREAGLNGQRFAAYNSMATNLNTLPTMQPHAPAYGSPELPYLMGTGPYVSSTVQPLPPAIGVPAGITSSLPTNPYFSSTMTMQSFAPDVRPQLNYPLPATTYVSTPMQAYVPASPWREENYALPTASYASSINMHPYAPASGWLAEPNHVPFHVTMQPHAPISSGMLAPNVPTSSHFTFLGANPSHFPFVGQANRFIN